MGEEYCISGSFVGRDSTRRPERVTFGTLSGSWLEVFQVTILAGGGYGAVLIPRRLSSQYQSAHEQ
jgi:hypothetical protein